MYPFLFFTAYIWTNSQARTQGSYIWFGKQLRVRFFIQQEVFTLDFDLWHKSKFHNMVTWHKCYAISNLAVYVIWSVLN